MNAVSADQGRRTGWRPWAEAESWAGARCVRFRKPRLARPGVVPPNARRPSRRRAARIQVVLPAHTARTRNTPPLLHDMCGLVHRSVEIRPAVKGDRITDGVGSSADTPVAAAERSSRCARTLERSCRGPNARWIRSRCGNAGTMLGTATGLPEIACFAAASASCSRASPGRLML